MATVKFPSEMPLASNIAGGDKLMISKEANGEAYQATFDQAKTYLNITGIELEPLEGGIDSANATVVPAGPTGENRKAEASPGWYNFGSGPVEATADKRWTAFWNGTTWSLVDMGALPVETKSTVIDEGILLAPTTDAVWKSDYLDRNKVSKSSTTRNMFDKDSIVTGKYLDAVSGNIVSTSSSGRNISEYIPVVDGQPYIVSGANPNPVNQRISFFLTKGSTVADAKFGLSFTPSSDGFVVIDAQDVDLDNLQLEEGTIATTYERYEPVVSEIYDYPLNSKYAEKTIKQPVEQDDIVPLSFIGTITTYDLYRDEDFLFDLNDPNFLQIYSATSKLGYIRTLDRSGSVNRFQFHIGKNQYTVGPNVNVTIGFVPSVAPFNVSAVTIIGTVQIPLDSLPDTGVVLLTVDLETPIPVIEDMNLVVLFDSPTRMPIYNNTVDGYSLLYSTSGTPNNWSYGYQKSGGIIITYINENTEKFIESVVISNKNYNNEYPFEGLKIAVLGDSITAHAGSWARILFSKYGSNYVNMAISGAKFKDNADTQINFSSSLESSSPDNTAFNQVLRLAQVITPAGSQITITNPYNGESFSVPTESGVGTGTFTQPDLIIVAMGTNDIALDVPNAIETYIDIPINDLDRKLNMVTGMRWCTEMLRALCPNAQIIFSTPIQSYPGSPRRYYVTKIKRDRIIENCGYYSAPVIDSFNESGIAEKFERPSAEGPGKYLDDGLHPGDKGKQLMADFLGNRIIKLLNSNFTR